MPWAIVEWHVHRIATDRAALVAALEAPEGTWRWRALEEYAVRPDGEKALRLELVTALCEMVDPAGRPDFSSPVDSGERVEQRWRYLVRLTDTWGIVGIAGENLVTVCGSLRPAASALRTARVRIGGQWRQLPTSNTAQLGPGLRHIAEAGDLLKVQRLSRLAAPSADPVLSRSSHGQEMHLLRLSDHRVPAQARVGEFNDSDALVVFVAGREPDRDEAQELAEAE